MLVNIGISECGREIFSSICLPYFEKTVLTNDKCHLFPNNGRLLCNKAGLFPNNAMLFSNTSGVF